MGWILKKISRNVRSPRRSSGEYEETSRRKEGHPPSIFLATLSLSSYVCRMINEVTSMFTAITPLQEYSTAIQPLAVLSTGPPVAREAAPRSNQQEAALPPAPAGAPRRPLQTACGRPVGSAAGGQVGANHTILCLLGCVLEYIMLEIVFHALLSVCRLFHCCCL